MEKYNLKTMYDNYQIAGKSDESNISEKYAEINESNRYDEDSKFTTNIDKNKKTTSSAIASYNIDTESSDEHDIDSELKIENIKKFNSINEIPDFLETVKNHYVNLRLNLDRHEVSRLITKTLNVALLGDITQESQIYELFMGSYDEIKNKVKTIIQKIREFNKNNNYEYWVDLDKIVYILWFKEIKFVRNLIVDIDEKLEYQLNIVHVNSYLIDRLYNDPKYTKYYIKILLMVIEKDTESFLSNDKLKNFFTADKIYKIYDMIRLITICDSEFLEFLDKCKGIKLEKEKENNDINKNNDFNNIEELEKQFHREKKEMLTSEKKRNLTLDMLFKENQSDSVFFKKYVNKLFQKESNEINGNVPTIKEILSNLDNIMWNSFTLFIYKKFNFDINKYIDKIKEITQDYTIVLDRLNDIEVPFTIRINPDNDGDRGTILKGGDSIYFKKYLKYKEKYMKLKLYNSI